VEKSKCIEGKRKCEALLANPDFQWFLKRQSSNRTDWKTPTP